MSASRLKLPADLSPESVETLTAEAAQLLRRGEDVHLDCNEIRQLDSLGLALFASLRAEAASVGRELVLHAVSAPLAEELGKVPAPAAEEPPGEAPGIFEKIGDGAFALGREWKHIALLLTESLYYSTIGWRKPKTLLRGDAVKHMIRLGSTALPIVLLLSALIGFTLALQSGLQLVKYGAAIFLADGIGISMVTEIGPLITAIILAGRSGSAITAELATMTVQEEVSALRSMAVNPLQFLVLPRFWALSAVQPLLTTASAMAGIFSGLIVAIMFFDIAPQAFLHQLRDAIEMKYVGQMLIKSVTFAWLIVFIAVVKGLAVRGGADAVGRATTACVVNCIFAIVLADALFSFVFYL